MKRTLTLAGTAALLALAVASGTAFAAPNPAGTGQPNQSCQAEPSGPAGLTSTTNGFATTAVNVYANPDAQGGTSSANVHVVSQYDVACFEVSQHR